MEYKYKIGDIIEDISSGKLEIINQIRITYGKKDRKGYIYECLICGNTDKIDEYNLKNKKGCNVCCTPSRKVLKGYNDLWTTHPDIAKLLKNPEDGYLLSFGSHSRKDFICPRCLYEIKNRKILNVVNYDLSCHRCSDGISYPEKFMINVLSQIKIEFKTQNIFGWSKNVKHINKKLSGTKKYDFYISSIECIIETHGGQHYDDINKFKKTLEEEQENDRLKENLAKQNKISNYIVIDCKKSELEYIKNNILISELNNLFDLSNIDWLKCHEYACNSLVKESCDLWNNGIKDLKDISRKLTIHKTTIIRYLKQGVELGWCNYNPKEEMRNCAKRNREKCKKSIIQLTENIIYIKTWTSVSKAEQKLRINNISKVCKCKGDLAGGFKWMYKEDYDQYIKQQKFSNNNLHILVD